ncbi:MAG: hypothetical protein V2B20_13225 [Pseudomonadota bacterium]
MSSYGESRFCATYIRRHPITGPIANNLFRDILGTLTLGAGITGILSFTTGTQLQVPGGNSSQYFFPLTLLQRPYLGMFFLAFMYSAAISGTVLSGFSAASGYKEKNSTR